MGMNRVTGKNDSFIGLQKYTNALLVTFRTINVSNAICYGNTTPFKAYMHSERRAGGRENMNIFEGMGAV
jgi:hypothetical protein